jgi:uncharacterized protein YegP (UPF0339 family)
VNGRYVEILQNEEGEWYWHVVGANQSDIVADSGETYVHRKDALAMAASLFPNLPIKDPLGDAGGDTPSPG